MLFNTPQYILFLPIVVVIYYLLPGKGRSFWLLGTSYFFYMQWNSVYLILLFACTLLTYIGGRYIGKLKDAEKNATEIVVVKRIRKKQKGCLFICILIILCNLIFLKYLGLIIYLEFP